MRVAFYTLGCKVNQYEVEALRELFEAEGYEIVPSTESADIFIINSCTVTSVGDKKNRQLIRRFRRENPGALIALTGCFPQAFPEEAAALTEADIVLGSRERSRLPEQVQRLLFERKHSSGGRIVEISNYEAGEPFEAMRASSFTDHTRAFLKIEDGCDRYCSYCIIPKARGPIRSKPIPALSEELSVLAAGGYREIVLVGVNLSSYGKEADFSFRLADAVELACSFSGVARVRLGSLEPELLTGEDLNRLAAQKKFCPHFHLSLQSGCAATLTRMNRHYSPGEYLKLLEQIRFRFPDVAITTDMMVGFPGETEEEFYTSLAFLEEAAFAQVHVFTYSVREGTHAAQMDGQVPPGEKERRRRILQQAADQSSYRFYERQVSTLREVLFEAPSQPGFANGHTENYTPVTIPSSQNLRGKILPVLIQSASSQGCAGILPPCMGGNWKDSPQ